ncbi:transporter substrate-binding domain-containing protein [Kutzneria sp. NPDC051319]|uniref:transporter substrate-binding domain-containing protein n=1 Tax=Kutzneria sp. NPDC051319 TaxID=3155047 RepID=UPI003422AF3D
MFRSGVLGVSLAALAVVLTACGSATAEDPAAATSPVTYPTQDVVSSLSVDAALHAELPPSTTSLTLGTTLSPGTAGLPHGGTVNGKNVGLDVDLRDAVAKVLGITWTVQNGTFETIIPGVQNGKYDVGQDNFGVTAAREKVVDFATYLSDGQSFLGPADRGPAGVKTLQDLCGLTVATSPGSTFQQILTSGADKCAAAGKKPYSVQLFSDTAPIWLGLANGKVDVYFGPTLSLKYDETHVPDTKFLGQFSSTPVGFVTGKGSPVAKAVSDAVNKLIATGDYAKILGKWGVDSSGITRSAVNPTPTL